MKTPLAILPILFFLVSCSTSNPVQDKFVKCLLHENAKQFHTPNILYTPDNSSFSSVLQSYIRNLRFNTSTTPKPLAIVTPYITPQITATILCAKNSSLQIRIRSGGHDYDGLSYVSTVPFVILDMFNIKGIDIDVANETAWVSSGATTGELYYRIAEKSKTLAFPAGVCFTLGAGGHFSGGGYGNLMRKYGLSVDNIVDAYLIDANGNYLNRASMGEDLFWAIRGGGAASFGVVHSWKIKLVKVPEVVTVFKVDRTVEKDNATDLVYKWQQVADKLDNDLFIRLTLGVVNGSQESTKTVKASFMALFLGETERLLGLMNESFPELGLQTKDCIEKSWVESTLFWMDYPNGTSTDVLLQRIPKSLIYLKRKSDYVKKPISKNDLESIWKKMIEVGKVGMAWNPYGGRMGEIPATETPFPHRAGNIFKIQYSANWMETDLESTNRNLNLTSSLFDFMTPFVSKSPREAFLNYRDIDIGSNLNGNSSDYAVKYFKDNLDRLVRVKTKADPDNFFKYEQSIPTLHSYLEKETGGITETVIG